MAEGGHCVVRKSQGEGWLLLLCILFGYSYLFSFIQRRCFVFVMACCLFVFNKTLFATHKARLAKHKDQHDHIETVSNSMNHMSHHHIKHQPIK